MRNLSESGVTSLESKCNTFSMSLKDAIDKKVKAATDAALAQKYNSDMGQKVHIERHRVEGARVDELRDVLRDIAKDLQETGTVTKEIKYLGSFSVHVYYSEVMKRMEFATLSAPDHVPFNVAEDASREMFGTICETYGKPRQKRRSGAS